MAGNTLGLGSAELGTYKRHQCDTESVRHQESHIHEEQDPTVSRLDLLDKSVTRKGRIGSDYQELIKNYYQELTKMIARPHAMHVSRVYSV